MPNRNSHPAGTPSWLDLATTDIEGSKAFYSDIFGWEWEQNATDQPDDFYYMAKLKGRDAAGMMQQAQEQVDMGIPCCWNLYLTVDDVDRVSLEGRDLRCETIRAGDVVRIHPRHQRCAAELEARVQRLDQTGRRTVHDLDARIAPRPLIEA